MKNSVDEAGKSDADEDDKPSFFNLPYKHVISVPQTTPTNLFSKHLRALASGRGGGNFVGVIFKKKLL